MLKNKQYLFFLFCILLIFITNFVFVKKVFASPSITSFLLNGSSQNVTFNPNNSGNNGKVSIQVTTNEQVKFTRVYICSVSQTCNGSSGNYTRYFSPNVTSDSVTETWDGKGVGDTTVVPAGEYKIMVSMIEGSNPTVSLTGQYSIFVDLSIQDNSTSTSTTTPDSDTDTSTSTTATSSQNQTVIVTKTVYISAHSSQENLSNYNEQADFQTSAGRERMALIGAPIKFDAKYSTSNISYTPSFKWSFGDGFDAIGKNVTHTYKYAGEYQVVLNGACGEYNSISRTIVKVIAPEISINTLPNGDVEIKNKGKTEINIGNWKVNSREKDFVFPQDTIISAGNKIILSKEDLNISSSTERVALSNPSGREVTYFNLISREQENSVLSMVATTTQAERLLDSTSISVAEAEVLAEQYKKQVAVSQTPQKITTLTDDSKYLSKDDNIQETATVAEAVTSSSTKSFWTKLIDIPIKGLKAFAHIFYNF